MFFHNHRMKTQPILTLTACLLLMGGCSDNTSSNPSATASGTDSSDVSSPPNNQAQPELLAPPKEGQGLQYQMTANIEPGVETELCKFVVSPSEPIFVNRDEAKFSQGSHHFLLYLTPYTEIPTTAENGKEIDTSGVFDCKNGATADWTVTKLIGGSQNATGDSVIYFPPNVAMRIPANSVLLMNAHYINSTVDVLDPVVQVNLHTISESEVKHEGDVMFWYNMFIEVPSKSEGRARMRCPIDSDITVTNIQSHMHARGVGYSAALMTDGKLEPAFYETDSWESVPVKRFDDGLNVPKGTTIDFYCDYKNNTDKLIAQGPKTTDEMCMFIASYYPAKEHTSLCSGDPDAPRKTQYLGADWVGDGTATCMESMTCLQMASNKAQEGEANFPVELAKCIGKASPDVAQAYSAGIRCLFLAIMDGKDPMTACTTEIAACAAQ